MITLQEALSDGRGIERPFNCHVHEDTSASATVNVAKGLWYCHGCGAHGKTDDIKPSAEALFHMLEAKREQNTMPESWLDLFDAHTPSPYWVQRYGERTAAKFRCGTDPGTGLPTYPMRTANGNVTGVVLRTAGINGLPKYMTPAGAKTSMTLFTDPNNYRQGKLIRKPVIILVEGPPDVMALDQSGVPDNWMVAAVFGANLLDGQAAILQELMPKTVIFAFDDDAAGSAGAIKAASLLQPPITTLSVRWGMFGGKDPGELPVDKRTLPIKQALESRN